MDLSKQRVLMRSDGATYEVVADASVLIRLDTGTYIFLNQAGTQVWEMLDGKGRNVNRAAAIAATYDAEADMVTADLIELAEQLLADSLVVVI